MKTLTLTDDAVELLSVLLHENADTLSASIRRRFRPDVTRWRGRTPTSGDVLAAEELELTNRLILMLEAE